MLPRVLRIVAVFAGLTVSCAFAEVVPPILPRSFGEWTQAGDLHSVFDPANAAVLQEYGVKDSVTGTYAHGTSRLTLHAMRFGDATGAYGAFTFFRQSPLRALPPAQSIGKDAAAAGPHAIFWTGATVVDAIFNRPETSSAMALQSLARLIPQPAGTEGIPPSLPGYLPDGALDRSSTHYAIGPVAYAQGGGVLPPTIVSFDRAAEALTAQYAARNGKGTLTLLIYPTPQIAQDRANAIEALLKSGKVAGDPAGLIVKRSGPVVGFTSGSFSADEARSLLAGVKYEGFVTINNPKGYVSEVAKTAKLLLGITYLTVVLGGAAILLGLFFGGGRALIRVLRGKPASSVAEEEFISLRLSDQTDAHARES